MTHTDLARLHVISTRRILEAILAKHEADRVSWWQRVTYVLGLQRRTQG